MPYQSIAILSSMRRVKLALIGCGGIAQLVHIPSIKRLDNVELVAVCDIYEDVAREVAKKYGVDKWYTDYQEMFEKENIDAIVNTTWHAAHAKVTIDSANAGKHVFVEKPMAITIEECKAMIEACRRNGVKLMIGFMKRFDPSLRWVKREIDRGSLGDIFLVNSWYYDTIVHGDYVKGFVSEFVRPKKPLPVSSYTPTGDEHLNVLLNHGIHHADLLRWIGGDIKAVSSRFKAYDDGSYASTSIIEYESGAIGYFQLAGPVADDWDEGLIVKGSKGSVRAYIRFPYFRWRSEVTVYFKDRGEYTSKLFPYRDMYLEELKHFVNCIISDEEPKPDGYDGLKAQELIYAIYRSAKEGSRVLLK